MSEVANETVKGVDAENEVSSKWKPLRIWPPVVLLVVMVATRFLPQVIQEPTDWAWMVAALGPLLCCLGILIWWIAASRATWGERGLGFVLVVAIGTAAGMLVDPTMHGPGIIVMTVPMGMAAFAMGTILFSRVLSFRRTIIALVLAMIGFGFSTLFRAEGLWGNYALGLKWRWTPSSEQKLLASDAGQTAKIEKSAIETAIQNPQWAGFRGPNRNGIQQGSMVSADWHSHPPELLWKVPVGPGWSSFVVAGKLLFTQEQRGEREAVVCYDGDSGQEVWKHEFEARFDDPLGGPGPRATPTLSGGRLFALGATGHLMCLEPATGDVVWQRDLQEVADRDPPMWGFSSSPLVVDGKVMVHAGGKDDKGLLAFDSQSGDLVWSVPAGDHSYSSPQLITLLGRPTVACLTNQGLDLVSAKDGKVWLNYQWPVNNHRALQVQVLGDDSLVIPSTMGDGTRRLKITWAGDGLSAEEVWTSRNLKPDFNDMVVYQGNGYGFDGSIFASVDLETGDRNWKNGRYGKGQVLLLEDAGLLLVLSERGEAVLLKATPDDFEELVKFQVLEGKTWNHPVVVGDRLYVRNSREGACYRLKLEESVAVPEGLSPATK